MSTVKITKGQIILNDITNVVATGTFKSRKDIAKDANATVSRVSEILTEHKNSNVVIAYRHLDEFVKIQNKL